MSAAATAAGYLYASGRLRGRASRENGTEQQPEEKKSARPERQQLRVAVLPEQPAQEAAPRKTPKIEYRRKRWTAE